MRIQGADPVHNISRIEGVGSGIKPGTGAFVLIRAEGRLPGGFWSVLVDGERLTARLDRPLQPGAVYGGIMSADGKAIKASGPALSSRITDLLTSYNLPNDKASYLAVAALMGEGLSLSPENIRILRRTLSKSVDAERARLAARALAAGLDPEDPLADRILAVGQGGQGNMGPGGDDARDRPGDSQERGASKKVAKPDRPGNVEDPDDELETALKGAISAALSDGDLRSLAAPGPDGKGWLYAPFELSDGGVDFSGFFRILFNYSSGSTEKLVVDIRSGPSRRLLALSGNGERVSVRLASADERERKAFGVLYPDGSIGELDELDPGGELYSPVDDDV
ncbi:MAG: hypothetical protein E4H20_04540 [Spirochaetales bacterium]|nr:MAG: hypothetical protein E4H20_04540 [Spirochaetales bacterium]